MYGLAREWKIAEPIMDALRFQIQQHIGTKLSGIDSVWSIFVNYKDELLGGLACKRCWIEFSYGDKIMETSLFVENDFKTPR